MFIEKNLYRLLDTLPESLKQSIIEHPKQHELDEIILDIGRRPQARFGFKSEYLSKKIICQHDLNFCTRRINKFNDKNRAGIRKTLHRVSCIRNQEGKIIGLTYRIGRVTFGNVNIIRDVLKLNTSILIIGRPGAGKTTIIREIARILSNEISKRVIIVDTSNEIAGNDDTPNKVVGNSRRMPVSNSEILGKIMIEAVENHMPETLIIDEISNENQVMAARTISERGIQLIATVHGTSLENLIKNPILADLVGGVENVTLSDEFAKKRKSRKTCLERKNDTAFETVIALKTRTNLTVYTKVNEFVDNVLSEKKLKFQTRDIISNKKINILYQDLEKKENLENNKEKLNIIREKKA